MAGMAHGCQSSMQRFMGLDRNDYEVSRYGIASEAKLQRQRDLGENPNLLLIDSEEPK